MGDESSSSVPRLGQRSSDAIIRILLAFPDPLVSMALKQSLTTSGRVTILGPINNREQILPIVSMMRPHVTLLDEDLLDSHGIQLIEKIKKVDVSGKVILLCPSFKNGHAREFIRAGVDGYLSRTIPIPRLLTSIKTVLLGHYAITPDLAARAFLATPCPFTARETSVIHLLQDNASTAQISNSLCLAPGTVRNVISSILRKTGTSSRSNALDIAHTKGWV